MFLQIVSTRVHESIWRSVGWRWERVLMWGMVFDGRGGRDMETGKVRSWTAQGTKVVFLLWVGIVAILLMMWFLMTLYIAFITREVRATGWRSSRALMVPPFFVMKITLCCRPRSSGAEAETHPQQLSTVPQSLFTDDIWPWGCIYLGFFEGSVLKVRAEGLGLSVEIISLCCFVLCWVYCSDNNMPSIKFSYFILSYLILIVITCNMICSSLWFTFAALAYLRKKTLSLTNVNRRLVLV